MNAQVAIVVNGARLAEFIKKTDPGPRRADHFGERCLTDLRYRPIGFPFFAKMG